MKDTLRVLGRHKLPDHMDVIATEYVMRYRDGETVFVSDADEWRVTAYGNRGRLLWSIADPLLNSLTFAQARKEALDYLRWCDDPNRL